MSVSGAPSAFKDSRTIAVLFLLPAIKALDKSKISYLEESEIEEAIFLISIF
jgi:hypothetical protein